MRKVITIIIVFLLGLATSLQSSAYKEAFSQFDFEAQEQAYQTAVSLIDNEDEQFTYLQNLTSHERLNLLAYIGMRDFSSVDGQSLRESRVLSGYLVPLTRTNKEDIAVEDIDKFEKIIMKRVKNIVTSNRYNDELKRLYPKVAQRKPIDFWQSYDLFKNMIAFGRKNRSLYKNSPALEALQSLAAMMEEDVNLVASQVGMAHVSVKITYERAKSASAWYNIGENAIYINIADKDLTWTRLSGEIIWHELFHAYQRSLVKQNIQASFNTQKDNYNQAGQNQQYQIWLAAIYNANTIAYQVSENNFTMYNQQPLEKHAHHFGRQIYRSIMNAKF